MLLAWLGERRREAGPVQAAAAIDRVVATSEGRTRDVGGTVGTQGFASAVVAALGR